MTAPDSPLALLPNGFEDLLPPDAEQEAQAVSVLMETLSGYGYNRVKPPLVEFEESLLAPGPGAALVTETFRIMDPVSHRMMGVRSDITAQIARIASSRLSTEARPLRLAYANDVLRTKASQQRTQRQFCQVGCELIGRENAHADTEICVMALVGLRALGVEGVSLDLTLPRLVDKILEAHALANGEKQEIRKALEKREEETLAALDSGLRDTLRALLCTSGPAQKALDMLGSITLPEETRVDVERLCAVYETLSVALRDMELSDAQVTIDAVESRGFEYHHGIGFTLFAKNIRGELGRGGRYNILFGGSGETQSATGFTLYMDTVRQAMPGVPSEDKLFIPADEGWAAVKIWREKGWTVIRGTGGNEGRARCTHELKGGKLHAIKVGSGHL